MSTALLRALTCVLMCAVCQLALLDPVSAAVFACPTASGGTIYQDRPCPMGQAQSADQVTTRAQFPAGMHASWFDRPELATHQAQCNRQGCQCGPVRRGYDSGLSYAVADSLYLDGTWHRYEEAVAELVSADARQDSFGGLQSGIGEAACDILMSQLTLTQFAEETLRNMRDKARHAEDRGDDYPELCETSTGSDGSENVDDLSIYDMSAYDVVDERACERYRDLLQYRSMVSDAQALRMPRTGPQITADPE